MRVFKVIIGIISLAASIMIIFFQPSTHIRKMAVTLDDRGISTFYNIWKDPTPEIGTLIKIYVFNVTNSDSFMDNDEKLQLQEVGPYIYQEYTRQLNPKFRRTEPIIDSSPRTSLVWLPHLNKLREDDQFILPNVALLAIGSKIAKEYPHLKMAMNFFTGLTDSNLFIKQTFREFTFDYRSPLIAKAHMLFPNWIYFEKFGILDRIFDNENDRAVTYTGENDTRLGGLFYSYNGETLLPYWDSPCNRLQGTSIGFKFGENLGLNETVYLYRKPLCRALPFIPEELVVKKSIGLTSTKYNLKQSDLDNGAKIIENKCFCRKGNCLADGLMDVTDCFYGFPIASSNPHFYNNAPFLSKQFDGLKPDGNLHSTNLFINRELGILTEGSLKLQINVVIGDTEGITHCNKFSRKVLPLLWVDVEIPELSTYYKLMLFFLSTGLPLIESIVTYLLLLVGIALITSALKTYLQMPSRRRIKFYFRKLSNASKTEIRDEVTSVYTETIIGLTHTFSSRNKNKL